MIKPTIEKDPCYNKGLKFATKATNIQANCTAIDADWQAPPINFSAELIDSLVRVAMKYKSDTALHAFIMRQGVNEKDAPMVMAFMAGWLCSHDVL